MVNQIDERKQRLDRLFNQCVQFGLKLPNVYYECKKDLSRVDVKEFDELIEYNVIKIKARHRGVINREAKLKARQAKKSLKREKNDRRHQKPVSQRKPKKKLKFISDIGKPGPRIVYVGMMYQ